MKAHWPGTMAGGGRSLASPRPHLPPLNHCGSCHHQDLINQHRQGPCCLMPWDGRKLQKRMENYSLVQKPQAAVADPAAAQPVPTSLPVPASTEDMA